MFLVALAAAAASPHSVTGAFGYVLGQAPVARSAECRVSTTASIKRTDISCPTQGVFSRIGVNAQLDQVTDVTGFRQYPAAQPDAALKTCLAELWRMKAQSQREHPGMFDAPARMAGWFQLSEQSLAGRFPTGRTITGYCDPRNAQSARAGGSYVLLWVQYAVSVEDRVRLNKLVTAGAK